MRCARVSCFSLLLLLSALAAPASAETVLINEIAWMGTVSSFSDEWIELHNPGIHAVFLDGWTLTADDGSPEIALSGVLGAGDYYLLERGDDEAVSDVAADLIYSGVLHNDGEALELRDADGLLIDRIDRWHAGDTRRRRP